MNKGLSQTRLPSEQCAVVDDLEGDFVDGEDENGLALLVGDAASDDGGVRDGDEDRDNNGLR